LKGLPLNLLIAHTSAGAYQDALQRARQLEGEIGVELRLRQDGAEKSTWVYALIRNDRNEVDSTVEHWR